MRRDLGFGRPTTFTIRVQTNNGLRPPLLPPAQVTALKVPLERAVNRPRIGNVCCGPSAHVPTSGQDRTVPEGQTNRKVALDRSFCF